MWSSLGAEQVSAGSFKVAASKGRKSVRRAEVGEAGGSAGAKQYYRKGANRWQNA